MARNTGFTERDIGLVRATFGAKDFKEQHMPESKVAAQGIWQGFPGRRFPPEYTTQFKSVDQLKAQVGRNGVLTIPMDKPVRIAFGDILMGGRVPEIRNLNKKTPFEVKVVREKGQNYLEIKAKEGAKYGQTDNVKLFSGPLVAPEFENKMAFPMKLMVGFDRPLILG